MYYRSSVTGRIKAWRKQNDPRKKNFIPTCLDFGPVKFYLARHFGFCYGVENAIEISYKALEENPDKNIYLISQMIHNQQVNEDLQHRGIRFILDTRGNQLIPWEQLTAEDIVIIPAFGTTLEIEKTLNAMGMDIKRYNTTCPFVEKVWNRAGQLGDEKYTVVIHGKPEHEETRSTFSHSKERAPSIVIRNMEEAQRLGEFITGKRPVDEFYTLFEKRISSNFNFEQHLSRLGVVNQTTMLASETQAIVDYLRALMVTKYGEENIKEHFADTRDTLCYATNDNQDATHKLMEQEVDMAIVVGGYNSSNTSHIAMLCAQKTPTYLIHSADEIKSQNEIHHFDPHKKTNVVTTDFLPATVPLKIALTSGASCPDTLVDQIIEKTLQFFEPTVSIDELIDQLESNTIGSPLA